MTNKKTYNLIEYMNAYGTEEQCEEALFHLKWKQGFHCPKCDGNHYTTVSTRRHHLYQCSQCGHQTTVTVGTIMENSKLSLVKWFLALFFMAQNKNSISSVALAKDLGITQASAWLMLRKIRSAMGSRDELYMLGGTVEMDEGFFGGKKAGGKRGRGADKAKVAVALEISDEGYPIFLKMEVIPDCKGTTLNDFANENITKGTTIYCDTYSSYGALKQDYNLEQEVYAKTNNTEFLKWLHVMISNVKGMLLGTFHGITEKHLQDYLNEFCYRFNRRHNPKPVLDHLLECCVWASYKKAAELTM